jgi:exodeoxyribonuclease III
MKIATWNVNGIRARQGQLLDWLEAERPDIVCLQEIKASLDQLPFELRDMEGYWSYWHGEKGYSGVALLVAKSLLGAAPACSHPGFDFEQRIACATVRLRAADRHGPPARADRRVGLRPERRQGLRRQDALSRGDRVVRRRCRTRRPAPDSVR